ncbi:immunity 26/phosphotriesterase HocA family protein [Chitinophaga sp. CF418]|uniref:immunity 26/phosphotriesterase HocA family protein n=1 Tax=Chitinophaga sp. CF418 TaxID=1855287 RepID=UPI000919E4D1|nr:immunity 26/phosphotriesterase HocA family protein [Chitinophaga sp. CF418]SHN34378.1 Immunity protein 26 [Chitinophaga sp. CF418]
MKRQKITIGSIIRIKLPCHKYAYARILKNANYAIYDLITENEFEDINEIISKNILFIIAVYDKAVTSGRWPKIGNAALETTLDTLPMKFIQDPVDSSQFRLYDPNTGNMTKGQRKDCIDLEKAAVWEGEQVEERICDHYAGKPNRWVEQMRMK